MNCRLVTPSPDDASEQAGAKQTAGKRPFPMHGRLHNKAVSIHRVGRHEEALELYHQSVRARVGALMSSCRYGEAERMQKMSARSIDGAGVKYGGGGEAEAAEAAEARTISARHGGANAGAAARAVTSEAVGEAVGAIGGALTQLSSPRGKEAEEDDDSDDSVAKLLDLYPCCYREPQAFLPRRIPVEIKHESDDCGIDALADDDDEDAAESAATLYGMALCHLERGCVGDGDDFGGLGIESLCRAEELLLMALEILPVTAFGIAAIGDAADSGGGGARANNFRFMNLAADIQHAIAQLKYLQSAYGISIANANANANAGTTSDEAINALSESLRLRTVATRAHRAAIACRGGVVTTRKDHRIKALLERDMADAISLMGRVCWTSGDSRSALDYLRQAYHVRSALYGEDGLPTLATRYSMALVLYSLVAASPAGADQESALEETERDVAGFAHHPHVASFPGLAPHRAEALYALSVILEARCKIREATAALWGAVGEARSLRDRDGIRPSLSDLESYPRLFDLCLRAGDRASALAAASEAVLLHGALKLPPPSPASAFMPTGTGLAGGALLLDYRAAALAARAQHGRGAFLWSFLYRVSHARHFVETLGGAL